MRTAEKLENLTLEELQKVKISSVIQGRSLAAVILLKQKEVHKQMVGLYDNKKWQELSDLHYDLRKLRINVLHETGLLAMALKQKNTNKK